MRAFFCAALNCLVGDEPCVPAATQIASAGVRPTRDVALVLIRNPEREPVDFDAPGFCEVKDVFVAVVQEALRIDWLEMSVRFNCRMPILDRDRLDPVNCVLQDEI